MIAFANKAADGQCCSVGSIDNMPENCASQDLLVRLSSRSLGVYSIIPCRVTVLLTIPVAIPVAIPVEAMAD